MPKPRQRLDLLWLPASPDAAVDPAAFERLRVRWAARGWLDGGASAPAGGFRRIWLDDPGAVRFYANQLGGFRVSCPRCGQNAVAGFGTAMRAWRAGGPRVGRCAACGLAADLDAWAFRPAAAFARGAVVLSDVGQPDVSPEVAEELDAVTGPSRVVLRRPV